MSGVPVVRADTPFTYQGRLDADGQPFSGTVVVKLRLFRNSYPTPTLIRSETIPNVEVSNGLFAVTPGGFQPSDFGTGGLGDSLEIQVSMDGGTTFTVLNPRQRVTYAPLALNAETAKTLSGSINASQISGGTTTSTMSFNPSGGGAPFAVPNAAAPTVANLSADKLDGLDSSVFLQKTGGAMSGNLAVTGTATLGFGATARQMVNLWNTDFGIGVQNETLYQRSYKNFAWFRGGVHDNGALTPGTGGTMSMSLDGNGGLDIQGSNAGYGMLNRGDPAKRWVLYSQTGGPQGDAFRVWSQGAGDRATISSAGNLWLAGSLSATVLTVRGGADLAEPFPMSGPEEMEPGSVVVIDPDHEGRLCLGATPYDKKVAGVISGAGGVQPGLRLHQEGVMEGDHHVALSGRVHVRAVASNGPIQPGDLLTTSELPGRAMKATDPLRSQGAVLGKAMTRLDHGEGLVLVLVTLQ